MLSFFKRQLKAFFMNDRYQIVQKSPETLWSYPLNFINSSQKWENLQDKKVIVLLVNTATGCGLKKQLFDLQNLHHHFSHAGLAVVAVPSADFMGQEKRDGQDLISHCETIYGVQYLLTEKTHVKGAQIHPLFMWLKKFIAPKWNYQKYLFDHNGHVRYIYDPRFEDFAQISEDIRKLIDEKNN